MDFLREFLQQRGIDTDRLADALYDYVENTRSQELDVYKEQELAVEESSFFFYLLTGIHFKDGQKFRNRNKKRGRKSTAEEEE